VSGSQRDLLIDTLHRFAVTAAGQRLVFDNKALADTLDEAKIDCFRTLVDLDDAGRRRIGLKVMEKMKLTRGGWLSRQNSSIGRLRPSMR
jgi:hypothetical protein